MCVHERPQERLETYGAAYLRDSELLAMVLRSGTAGCHVLQVAELILREAGSLAGLVGWNLEDFRRFRGIGRVKALQLVTVVELARRIQSESIGKAPLMREPADIVRYLDPLARGLTVEKIWVLSLNTRGRLIRCTEISSGTATASLVHPREVYREALRVSAAGVAVAHNHPSGDPQPSSADICVTKQLKESARIIGLEFVDHVIVGRPETDPAGRGWFSFRGAGMA
ncbi:MAG: DNA repair protein RadC [Opitutaceae bacterium]